MGLSNNSRIGHKSGSITPESIALKDGKLTFTLKEATGNPNIEGSTKAVTKTIDITDTTALKNVLRPNNSFSDNQLEDFIKLIQKKYQEEKDLENRKEENNSTDGNPVNEGSTNAVFTEAQKKELEQKRNYNDQQENKKKNLEKFNSLG
jgi:hypothetical protein